MKLTEHDLRQIDEEYINSLHEDLLRELALNLLYKTKELMDRVNQNASNSSIPPSKEAPWSQGNSDVDQCDNSSTDDAEHSGNTLSTPKKKPGKQPGAKGYGRTVELPVTQTQAHIPSHCAACNAELNENDPCCAVTGLYVLDIEMPENNPGIRTLHTKHIYI